MATGAGEIRAAGGNTLKERLRFGLSSMFRPVRLTMALQTTKALNDVSWKLSGAAREPAPYELATTYRIVRNAWVLGKSLLTLPSVHRRRTPFILFWPEAEDQLGNDPHFIRAFCRSLSPSRDFRIVGNLLHVFLLHYPEDNDVRSAFFTELRGLLAAAPPGHSGANMLRKLCERFGLLHEEGPLRVASFGLESLDDPEMFLSNAGLTHGLDHGEFFRHVLRAALGILNRSLQVGTARRDQVDWFLRIAAVDGGLRFERSEERGLLANTLLEPFDSNPAAYAGGIRDVLFRFFVKFFEHPRINSRPWQKASEVARRVMEQWLVSETLEEFFTILRHTAREDHWEDREDFWRHYLDANAIEEAWIVFGPQAERVARGQLHQLKKSYGTFEGPVADRNRSSLLFRIDNLIIAEWTHNGKCRIWHDSDPSRPQLYKPTYRQRELMDGTDVRFRHWGNWQGRVAAYVRRHTGVSGPSRLHRFG